MNNEKNHTRYIDIESFVTRDASTIRELMHPASHSVHHQSLAEAIVEPGQTTLLHRHTESEEIYYILSGKGQMTLGEHQFMVARRDSIVIRPGTAHCIKNVGANPLIILCCCAPAYSDQDTELLV